MLRGSDIEIICKNKMEYLFMASLISSDNIRTIKDAEESLKFIGEVEEALKTAQISEDKKKEFEKYIEKGKNILQTDVEIFKNEK